MTFEEYIALPQREQEKALDQAVLLIKKKEGEKTYYLYQLEGFYIEFLFRSRNPLDAKLEAFTSLDRLEPYLKEINID